MVHRIIIRKRAITQFQAICDYLTEEFGLTAADDFEFEIENCVETLRRFPESGHLEPIDSRFQYRSKIVGKYNKMYYYLSGNTLIIAAFADMRMHPDNVTKAVTGKL
jgi:plasmid stabilization system protein ParE